MTTSAGLFLTKKMVSLVHGCTCVGLRYYYDAQVVGMALTKKPDQVSQPPSPENNII